MAKTPTATHSLAIARTVFMLGLGTRGARATLPGTIALDASKVPAEINAMIYETGADILLRQASQDAEKAQIKEWKALPHNKGKEPPAIRVFPFDYDRLRKDALAAMERRVQDWYAGEPGRDRPMNQIERRAAALVEAGLRTAYNARKLALPDQAVLDKMVQDVLGDAVKGDKYRKQAQDQLEAERAAAVTYADDLGDLIPATVKPGKPAKAEPAPPTA